MKTLKTLVLLFTTAAALLLVSCGPSMFDLEGTYEPPANGNDDDNSLKLVITNYNLQDYVAVPTTGAAPVWEFSRPDVLVSVSWQEEEARTAISIDEGFTFVEGRIYRAAITLTTQNGYQFSPDFPFFYLSDTVKVENDPRDANERVITVLYPPTKSPVSIKDLNLSSKVPVPVRGGTPVSYFASPEYTGTVDWNPEPSSGLFNAGTLYKATITLTAAAGYTFKNVEQNAFTHSAGVVSYAAGSEKVMIEFQKTDGSAATDNTVTDTNLTRYVPAPVRDGTAIGTFSTPQYIGTITWALADGSAHSGLFESKKKYKATVTLTAALGYTFNGMTKVFSHDNADDQVSSNPATVIIGEATATVSIIFTETTEKRVQTVTDTGLTPYIPAPGTGGIPVHNFSASQYIGTVVWKQNGIPYHGLFQAGTVYTAEISLTPASGYTFKGMPGVFSHADADSNPVTVINEDDTAAVSISFPITERMVTETNLSSLFSAPEVGAAPDVTVNSTSGQYTGSVSWSPAGNLFKLDTAYTATVTLKAEPGYTFAGIAEDTFKYDGSGVTVTHNAGAGAGLTVTVKFPMLLAAISAFSNGVNEKGSAIDAITLAASTNSSSVSIIFNQAGTEKVDFDNPDTTDIGTGLILENTTGAPITSPPIVTIDGGGRTVDLGGKAQGALITVKKGVTLTLRNLVLDGMMNNSALIKVDGGALIIYEVDFLNNQGAAAVEVNSGGAFIMHSGTAIGINPAAVVVKDGTFTMNRGTIGAVEVDSGGAFTLNGGSTGTVTVNGNGSMTLNDGTPGTVTVNGNGTFTMNGSRVSVNVNDNGNFTLNGGTSGTVTVNNGKFTMKGGSITTLKVNNGTFTMKGGDITSANPVKGGTMTGGTINNSLSVSAGDVFTMSGGTIKGLSVLANGTFDMTGGNIRSSTSVNVQGLFTMSGGSISSGGGVSVKSTGIFTMKGGDIIDNGSSGVSVDGGTFNMSSGTISGNSSSGVFVKSNGTFDLVGGTISGNTSSGNGGGVYVESGCTFTMKGGTISGNTASNNGGGVYVESGGSFTKNNGTGKPCGTIYGSDAAPALQNTASGGSGHAVYADGATPTVRDTTLDVGNTY